MITIKEIARLAGVSAKTAERALSGATKDKRRDARERADRVRQIAAAHGYQPSEVALALRRGSTRSFGFLVDILTDQFLAAAVETAIDEAGQKDYKIALQLARFDKEQSAEAIKAFLASGMEGI
ncbi:MAG: LacI family DNA-binding transcriptional regulator, partial [Lentisphaeria bacterium]|nr:LacI family DNA-binding transcriptional regulator [Lentisphaeria bacterium]